MDLNYLPRLRQHLDRALGRETYQITRFLILRLLGFVYLAAFASLVGQLLPLIGKNGLLPADRYLQKIEQAAGSPFAAFLEIPTLFFVDATDSTLLFFAWLGVVLSLVVLAGFANAILMAFLWALYMSFVHIGQLWYGYGWEIELLENGFLAIFLCPLLDGRPLSPRPTPLTLILLYRWLAFRIMLGAGLIKIRGDACWRELTCLEFHYETQPIPNPVSPLLHFMPGWFHALGVLYNHLAELILPWFIFGPRRTRHVAGILLVAFQLMLIVSGNLSFLNWLTLVPLLACFDDRLLRSYLPQILVHHAECATLSGISFTRARKVTLALLAALVAVLSINPVANLLSGQQVMNQAFDNLALVNTYGAFGSVGQIRHEIIFEGTTDRNINESTKWKPYEFPCKPGDPLKMPCITGPYQRRLDWHIWFAAMSTPQQAPWTIHFVWKLLHNDPGTLGLLANNPFPDAPPHAIRATLYRYEFAPLDDPEGAWWERQEVRPWLPPLGRDDPRLRAFLDAFGW